MSGRNVYMTDLQKCSRQGESITGFERTGFCTNHGGDRGSHHVCMDLNLRDGSNFCRRTGQPNWCDDHDRCDGQPTKKCPRKHWCVCQWAFSRALEQIPCEQIHVDCNATAIEALRAYDRNPRYAHAARCLRSKCNLR